jgi:hypothetical protein
LCCAISGRIASASEQDASGASSVKSRQASDRGRGDRAAPQALIFTEPRDTLEYLASNIRQQTAGQAVAIIHGGVPRDRVVFIQPVTKYPVANTRPRPSNAIPSRQNQRAPPLLPASTDNPPVAKNSVGVEQQPHSYGDENHREMSATTTHTSLPQTIVATMARHQYCPAIAISLLSLISSSCGGCVQHQLISFRASQASPSLPISLPTSVCRLISMP